MSGHVRPVASEFSTFGLSGSAFASMTRRSFFFYFPSSNSSSSFACSSTDLSWSLTSFRQSVCKNEVYVDTAPVGAATGVVRVDRQCRLFFFVLSLPFFLLILSGRCHRCKVYNRGYRSFSSNMLSITYPSTPVYLSTPISPSTSTYPSAES